MYRFILDKAYNYLLLLARNTCLVYDLFQIMTVVKLIPSIPFVQNICKRLPNDILTTVYSFLRDEFCSCNVNIYSEFHSFNCSCGLYLDLRAINILRFELFSNLKHNYIYIASYSNFREFIRLGDNEVEKIITRCKYDILHNNYIIEKNKFCVTCLNYPDSKDSFYDNIDIVTIKEVKNYLTSKKIGDQYIPLNKQDCDYDEIKYCYDHILKWYNIYKSIIKT